MQPQLTENTSFDGFAEPAPFLHDLRVVVVSEDGAWTGEVLRLLQPAGAMLEAARPDVESLRRAGRLDPQLVLVDPGCRPTEHEAFRAALSADPRIRWALLAHGGRPVALEGLLELATTAVVPERQLVAEVLLAGTRPFLPPFDAMGPSRLLRALGSLDGIHRITVHDGAAEASVIVTRGRVLGSCWRAQGVPGTTCEGLDAVAAYLGFGRGRAVVETLAAGPDAPQVGPLETVLDAAWMQHAMIFEPPEVGAGEPADTEQTLRVAMADVQREAGPAPQRAALALREAPEDSGIMLKSHLPLAAPATAAVTSSVPRSTEAAAEEAELELDELDIEVLEEAAAALAWATPTAEPLSVPAAPAADLLLDLPIEVGAPEPEMVQTDMAEMDMAPTEIPETEMPLFVFPKPLPPETEPSTPSVAPVAPPTRRRGSFLLSALIGFVLSTVLLTGAAAALVAVVGPSDVEARIAEQLVQVEIAAAGIDLGEIDLGELTIADPPAARPEAPAPATVQVDLTAQADPAPVVEGEAQPQTDGASGTSTTRAGEGHGRRRHRSRGAEARAERGRGRDLLAQAARAEPEEAMALYGRVLARYPNNARAMAGLARTHLSLGEADTAVHWADRALQTQPERVAYWRLLGDALRASGDATGAERAYVRARALSAGGEPAAETARPDPSQAQPPQAQPPQAQPPQAQPPQAQPPYAQPPQAQPPQAQPPQAQPLQAQPPRTGPAQPGTFRPAPVRAPVRPPTAPSAAAPAPGPGPTGALKP